jgi:putative molybdopterin biosynthesis protein
MTDRKNALRQDQFLNAIDRDEAERRFHAAVNLAPLGSETVPLDRTLGRVLAADVVARVNVPGFDRSDYDGFAVQASDTYGAREDEPRRVRLLNEAIACGDLPHETVQSGTGVPIATGAMLPRGANAVVMVEDTDVDGSQLIIRRAVTPGFGITYAGTDIAVGETVLRGGQVLTSRDTGVLAAIGQEAVSVWRSPRVAIISTGDELVEPGRECPAACVYDSNARILADAVAELGAEPRPWGIVRDEPRQLREIVSRALDECDAVLLSGGTSKGAGDVSYEVVSQLDDPGIVAHGVALKPGKPICLAASQGKPIVVLPGFPTSAIFTFHEFVAPVLRALAGRPADRKSAVRATLALKTRSAVGRTEYMLVRLVETDASASPARDTLRPANSDRIASASTTSKPALVAYPVGKGSGSVTTFSHADGFITIDRHQELLDAGQEVEVQLFGRDLEPADLVVIGSHCMGIDYLLGRLQEQGVRSKALAVGSTAGLEAVGRGECDLAGIHLLDEQSGEYNRPFLTEDMVLVRGYARRQGLVFRADDPRFDQPDAREAIRHASRLGDCLMVNRNFGSGTRILLDQLLQGAQPPGYSFQARSHHAVVAAIAQGRADWGVAIESVVTDPRLRFLPLADERFDFAVPKSRAARPPVVAFRELLTDPEVIRTLRRMGFLV